LAFFLLVILASGCAPRVDMSLPPEQIIQSASDRMQSLEGFSFLLDSVGAPAYLDYDGYYMFSQMEGDFVAPDRLRATFRVVTPGLVSEVATICIGDQQWETHWVTGEWVLLPPNLSFNPMLLFNPETGVQSIASGLTDLELTGVEELETMPGQKLYVVTGRMEGEHLYELSYGMMTFETLNAKLWIDPQTFDLYRIEMTEDTGAEEEKVWVIEFWNINETAVIEPPRIAED
jgi:lipoprotein LprG